MSISWTMYMESSINNPCYQVFAEHLCFQISYVASKRVNLLKSGPICSFSGPERLPNSNASSVFRLHRQTRAWPSASPSQLPWVRSSNTPQVGSHRLFLTWNHFVCLQRGQKLLSSSRKNASHTTRVASIFTVWTVWNKACTERSN